MRSGILSAGQHGYTEYCRENIDQIPPPYPEHMVVVEVYSPSEIYGITRLRYGACNCLRARFQIDALQPLPGYTYPIGHASEESLNSLKGDQPQRLLSPASTYTCLQFLAKGTRLLALVPVAYI